MVDDKELERLRASADDSEEWGEVEEIEVRTTRTEVVSFRLPSHELDELVDAAQAAGEKLSEYVRKAVNMRLHGAVNYSTPLDISSKSFRIIHGNLARTVLTGNPQMWTDHDTHTFSDMMLVEDRDEATSPRTRQEA